MKTLEIQGRSIGQHHPVFIIAEAGVNHNGDVNLARELIAAASKAGADAVKFQTFRAAKIVTGKAEKACYQKYNAPSEESQLSMLKRLELAEEDFVQLQEFANRLGIIFLSTPFEEESVDFLDNLGVPAFKVSSGDLTNLPLLRHIADKGKPVLMSTGMAYLEEVKDAVSALIGQGNPHVALFHCTSNYPPALADVNLMAIKTLSEAFAAPVGFSDHTPGDAAALAAVALGAVLLEKHITIDRRLPGPDHRASMEPEDFALLVAKVRSVKKMLGSGDKVPVPAEFETRKVARKSIVARVNIPMGTPLTRDMLVVKRPGTGLSPQCLDQVIGKVSNRDINEDEVISSEMLEGWSL